VELRLRPGAQRSGTRGLSITLTRPSGLDRSSMTRVPSMSKAWLSPCRPRLESEQRRRRPDRRCEADRRDTDPHSCARPQFEGAEARCRETRRGDDPQDSSARAGTTDEHDDAAQACADEVGGVNPARAVAARDQRKANRLAAQKNGVDRTR